MKILNKIYRNTQDGRSYYQPEYSFEKLNKFMQTRNNYDIH